MTGDTIIILVLTVLTLAGGIVAWIRVRTPVPGLCPNCRYSLGPTPEITTCPECGTKPERVIVAVVPKGFRRRLFFCYACSFAPVVLSMGYGRFIGEAIADVRFNGPRVTEWWSQHGSVHAFGYPGREIMIHVTSERDVWPDGRSVIRTLEIRVPGGARLGLLPTIELSFPPGPDDAAIETFLYDLGEYMAACSLPFDHDRASRALRKAIAEAMKDGRTDVVGILGCAWFPNAIPVEQVLNRATHRELNATHWSQWPPVLRNSLPRVGGTHPSPQLQDAESMARLVVGLPLAALQFLTLFAFPLRNRTRYAPWPPK
jgi:hypothetical protein